MAQTYDFNIACGSSKTGLTLHAQLIDADGNNVGSDISVGFIEIGGGNYFWQYSEFDDDFRGGVKFTADGESFIIFTSVSPNKLSPGAFDDIFIESGVNARQALSIIAAALGGVIAGTTNEVTIKAIGNPSTTRVVAQVDKKGNRTEITLNLPS